MRVLSTLPPLDGCLHLIDEYTLLSASSPLSYLLIDDAFADSHLIPATSSERTAKNSTAIIF